MSSRPYKVGFYRRLQNDEEVLYYLQAAIEDSRAAFLVALRNVVEARNMAQVARDSDVHRPNLYRMLSENGNPTIGSLEKVLGALGLRFSIEVAGGTADEQNETQEENPVVAGAV